MSAHGHEIPGGGDGHAGARPPRRSRLAAADRRETILRAAAGVFAEAGYRATKVSDIAAVVGVTEPVIFQNFGSKAALFAAVVERAAASAGTSLNDMAGSVPAHGLLAHVLAGPGRQNRSGDPGVRAGAAGHDGTAYGVLFGDAVTLAADPDLSEPARGAVRAVATHLTEVIRHAQADGGIRADVSPQAAAWLVLSVLAARRLRAAAMPDSIEPEITSLVLRALTPHPDGIPPPGTTGAPGAQDTPASS